MLTLVNISSRVLTGWSFFNLALLNRKQRCPRLTCVIIHEQLTASEKAAGRTRAAM